MADSRSSPAPRPSPRSPAARLVRMSGVKRRSARRGEAERSTPRHSRARPGRCSRARRCRSSRGSIHAAPGPSRTRGCACCCRSGVRSSKGRSACCCIAIRSRLRARFHARRVPAGGRPRPVGALHARRAAPRCRAARVLVSCRKLLEDPQGAAARLLASLRAIDAALLPQPLPPLASPRFFRRSRSSLADNPAAASEASRNTRVT
jgi:hypothetical protein